MPTYPEGDAPLVLKPENDEAQWPTQDANGREDGYAKGFDAGWADGWQSALGALRDLNLYDAVEKLEALNNGQLVPVAD